MTDYLEDYEGEVLEDSGYEARLLPDDREAFGAALCRSLRIFKVSSEAQTNDVMSVIETLEDFHPYFSDTLISDQIGEVIELLQEIAEERVLDFKDMQDGKHTVETLAETLGIEISHPEIE